jgi:hypothetical protein
LLLQKQPHSKLLPVFVSLYIYSNNMKSILNIPLHFLNIFYHFDIITIIYYIKLNENDNKGLNNDVIYKT